MEKKVEDTVNARISAIMEAIEKDNRDIKEMQKKLFDAWPQGPDEVIDVEQPRHIAGCSGEGQYRWVDPFGNKDLQKWTTKCGWRYAVSDFQRCWTVPEDIHFERNCKKVPSQREEGK